MSTETHSDLTFTRCLRILAVRHLRERHPQVEDTQVSVNLRLVVGGFFHVPNQYFSVGDSSFTKTTLPRARTQGGFRLESSAGNRPVQRRSAGTYRSKNDPLRECRATMFPDSSTRISGNPHAHCQDTYAFTTPAVCSAIACSSSVGTTRTRTVESDAEMSTADAGPTVARFAS
jgi:hypothetical protein